MSVDQDSHNPFRVLLSLIGTYDYIQAVVVATAAMHLATLRRHQGHPARAELVDALAAKGRAITALRAALDRDPEATVLAAIVFLVNLDLIDSGRGGWRAHIAAAESLMASLHRRYAAAGDAVNAAEDQSLVRLADAIAADCLTYRILGSTISATEDGTATATGSMARGEIDVAAVMRRAQAHSYHCCPPAIMRIILSASQLCEQGEKDPEGAAALLQQARALDVHAWVHGIRGLAPHDDLDVRVEVAAAHRAAACLYIVLALDAEGDVDAFVVEILSHLARVPMDHVHLKGTIWPTFMAGAQTDDTTRRAWCLERLRAVWTWHPFICPWGYIRTAMEMLERIWAARDDGDGDGDDDGDNWLRRLKSSREDCLIV